MGGQSPCLPEIIKGAEKSTMFELGIDVSKYQGKIDFQKVKDSKIEFVIIRAGYGKDASQKDPYFETNYTNAKAAGLNVGTYWYSYALTEDDVKKEAKAFMKVIAGKQFEYPVYLDLEYLNQLKNGKDFCSNVVRCFCGTLEKHKYFAGLYMSRFYLQTYIYPEVAEKYSLWIAEYGDKCRYNHPYDMWQKSDACQVNGISGNVDLDECYVNFPDIIKRNGLNGF